MLARFAWLSVFMFPGLCWAQDVPVITVVPTIGASTISWEVSVTPRVTGFVANSSVAVELDFEFTGTINSFTLNNAFWNVNGSNTGNNPFTGTNTETVLDQTPANDTLFIAAGSELFTTATPQLLGTIVTQGTSGTLSWGRRTAAGHQTSRIAQNGINYDGLLGSISAACGCLAPGDFDASGSVGNGDLTLLLDYWGDTVPPTPAGWDGLAPTAPGVGNDELTQLLDSWGDIAGAATAVPEPTALLLALLSTCILGLRRR
jgi:hypothetical protein